MSTSSTPNLRKKAVSSAVWSVRAEGLRPSKTASKNLKSYAAGKLSAKQLRKTTSSHVLRLAKTSR